MQLVYSDVIQNAPAEEELGIEKVEFETLLARSDFVSLHVPLNDQTRAMFNDAVFARMKPSAFLINCSRGEVVDSAALVRAVESGRIAGAGLDVYENEPGPADKVFADPVARADRIYGTHHIGASTEQAQLAVSEEVVRIVDHFNRTGEVLHCVNP
jgi:D-3-phosphoglycerate dehydrogenase